MWYDLNLHEKETIGPFFDFNCTNKLFGTSCVSDYENKN